MYERANMNVVNMRSEQSERRVAIALLSYAQSLSWSKLHASLLSLSAQHDTNSERSERAKSVAMRSMSEASTE
jgi:hypothetical protein